MCYRYVLQKEVLEALAASLGVACAVGWKSRYNIAPGSAVPAVKGAVGGGEKFRETVLLQWGLVFPWTRTEDVGPARTPANARAETLATRPAFRGAFRLRRCVIPAGGFFEWTDEDGRRQPHLLRRPDGQPLALAGLWEESLPGSPEELSGTCAIITTRANDLIKPIHDRMPAILSPEEVDRWLDPQLTESADLSPLLKPCPDAALEAVRITRRVNHLCNDDPECIEPAPRGGSGQYSLGI